MNNGKLTMSNEQCKMQKKIFLPISHFSLFTFLFSLFSVSFFLFSCGKGVSTVELQYTEPPFASFKDIPGVTAEEIAAIEALQKESRTFYYGMTLTTEAFIKENGEGGEYTVDGYAALFCQWLSSLFGIKFQPEVYAWNDLIDTLNAGTLDFAGNLIITEERRQRYYMTGAIAERQYKMMRLKGSPALARITQERPLRYAFLENAVHNQNVAAVTAPGTYEPVWVKDYTEVYDVLARGDADAFIAENAMEASFSAYENMYFEDFLPLIFSPIAMATAKDELKPVISVMSKAQENGIMPYLNNLYNQGYEAYKKHKFFMLLSENEKEYLRNTVSVPLLYQYFNYPVAFYDLHNKKWDGIAMDLLHEVEKLTGLTFNVINEKHAEMPELIPMLADGRGHIFVDLIRTKERESYFIWNKNKFMADQYALLSKIDYPNVNTNEIPYKRIALVLSTAHKEMFHTWFPDAVNTTEYVNLDDAFTALEHGKADLLMAAKTKLLYYLNYHEFPDYKANYLFNYSYESAFAFNKDQTDLCSIVDKAISIINTDVVVEQWITKTYDFRTQLAEARLPWLIGAIILFFMVLVLVLVLFYRSRNLREQNEADAIAREADAQAKLMLEYAPVVVILWDNNFKILDCNQEAVRIFGLSDKKEFIERFMDLAPEYQPNGKSSQEMFIDARSLILNETEFARMEWTVCHAVTGEEIPFATTLVHIKYKDGDAVLAYGHDLRERKASLEEIREANERAQLMTEHAPMVVMLWGSDRQLLDCNHEVVRVFGVSSKKEYMERFFELAPEYQPNGMTTQETFLKAHWMIFNETEYAHIEWIQNHAITGEAIPFDVTLVRIKYKDGYAALSFGQDMRDLRSAMAKMREADERAQIMLEQTPLVVMLWDKDANILDCNQEAVRVTGLSSKKEYKERLFELTPDLPDGTKSSEAAQKAIALCLETGYCRIPWALHHAVSGELIPFDVTIARVKYRGEDVAISYAQDLRELNAAIAKIREAEDRAKAMIEQAPLIVMLWDKDGNILDCNNEPLNVLGLSSKEEYIERFFELAPSQINGMTSFEAAKMLVSKTLETGLERVEWVQKHAVSGEEIPFDSTLVRIKYKDEYIMMSYGLDVRELKASTKLVMEKTSMLAAIFDTAHDLIFVKDLNSRYIQCNKSFESLMGCLCEDIIGKDDAEGLNAPPEVAAAFVAEDKKIFDKKEKVVFEDYILASDGTKVLFETVKSPLVINGKMTGLVGVARDITQRKAIEEELVRQHSLMDTVNMAAAVLLEPGTDGGISAINHSMEMVCQSVDADRVFLWQNFRKEDGSLHYKQLYKWTRPEYALDNGFPEYSYETVMPQWKDLLFKEKSINGPLDTLPGYDPEAFSIYALQSILIVPLFLQGEYWGFVSFDDCHSRHSFPEADEHILRSWGLLVVGATRRAKMMLDLEHAVEEAKRASSEAMKAYAEAETASEAKSRFIANMNHEMRTPMNVIVGLTDLMLEEKDVSGKAKETLHKINIAGNTLMGLINDVLDISKAEAGKMDLMTVEYDVASMLNDIITLNSIRAEDKPIEFKLDIDKNLPINLFGDDLRVKQILNNLLSNAFKYTKMGNVTLGVSCQRDGRRQADHVWLSFYVSDSGIGIRKEDVDKLFTDYNQVDTRANREIEGTGLGLSITKKLVELMEGEISVESEYGKGSVFYVRIRQGFVNDKTIGAETVQSLSSFRYSDEKRKTQKKLVRSDLSYARVMVVDDFPTNLDVAAGMLRKYKMQVDCVMSGQESIDLITAGEPVYNAIFMDHMMPGMDGVEAAKAIRALGTQYAQDIPIIALTANAVAESEKMFLANGFDAFLPKPFNVMDLDSVVQRWVRKK